MVSKLDYFANFNSLENMEYNVFYNLSCGPVYRKITDKKSGAAQVKISKDKNVKFLVTTISQKKEKSSGKSNFTGVDCVLALGGCCSIRQISTI